MEPECSLSHSQQSAACPYHQPDNMNTKKISTHQWPAKVIMTEYRRPEIMGDEGDWHLTARARTRTHAHTHTLVIIKRELRIPGLS
jgi:hypothetical protein